MTDYKDFLDNAVFEEKNPVTYKFLARSLGVHVKIAKQALYDFSVSQNNVHAVYCITGTKFNSLDLNVQLVKERELEVEKKKYKNISSVYVYCIAPQDLDDFSVLYTTAQNIPRVPLEDRIRCGVLRNTNVQHKSPAKDNKLPPNPSSLTSNVPISKQPVTADNSATKRKGFTSAETPASKKHMTQKPTKAIQAETKKSKRKTPVANFLIKKEANDGDIESRMAKTSLKIEDIFSDDEKEDEPQPPQEEEDVIMMEAEEEEKAKEPRKESEKIQETSAGPGKGKRKVVKTKTTTNARGLLVTEETVEWEPVDATEEETKESTAPKPTTVKPSINSTASKKTPANKKATQSRNILSFFGKKS